MIHRNRTNVFAPITSDARRRGLRLAAGLTIMAAAGGATAQSNDVPRELEGIDIIEHLDTDLPLDLSFVDASGAPVALRDFFTSDRPVIITLNYYRCPMLCTFQLNGLLEGLTGLDWKPGEEFQIVTVSFDPKEGPDLAASKKTSYAKSYAMTRAHQVYSHLEPREQAARSREFASEYQPQVEAGWAFLTGDEANIRALVDAIGYGIKWNAEKGEWAHPAAIMIATPDGRLSRYLYGVTFKTKDLKLGLLEASKGKIGSTIDRFLMWCFHYDDTTGQYTPAVMKILKAGGALTVLILGVGLFILWKRDTHRRVDARRAGGDSLAGTHV